MMTLYASKALRDALPVASDGRASENCVLLDGMDNQVDADAIESNRLGGWHGHLFKLKRRNCVLLVHNQTRFPLLLVGLTKKEFAALDYCFSDALMNTLLKMGASEQQLHAVSDALAPLLVKKSNNRSVQGTLNLMKGAIEHLLWYDNIKIMDLSPINTSIWLAQRPCNVKGLKTPIWPEEAMLQLLDELVASDIPDKQMMDKV